MGEAAVDLAATRHAAPVKHKGAAVGKRVFDRVGVVVLAAIRAVGDPPAHAVGGDRPCVLEPAALVDLVDHQPDEQARRCPQEPR